MTDGRADHTTPPCTAVALDVTPGGGERQWESLVLMGLSMI